MALASFPAMQCPNCDTALPDAASYCWHCGMAQRPGRLQAGQGIETCELCYAVDRAVLITCRFWARATGADGLYNAGTSTAWVGRFPDPADPRAVAAHAALVRRLVRDGWHSAGSGFLWFNSRFCRALAVQES